MCVATGPGQSRLSLQESPCGLIAGNDLPPRKAACIFMKLCIAIFPFLLCYFLAYRTTKYKQPFRKIPNQFIPMSIRVTYELKGHIKPYQDEPTPMS